MFCHACSLSGTTGDASLVSGSANSSAEATERVLTTARPPQRSPPSPASRTLRRVGHWPGDAAGVQEWAPAKRRVSHITGNKEFMKNLYLPMPVVRLQWPRRVMRMRYDTCYWGEACMLLSFLVMHTAAWHSGSPKPGYNNEIIIELSFCDRRMRIKIVFYSPIYTTSIDMFQTS